MVRRRMRSRAAAGEPLRKIRADVNISAPRKRAGRNRLCGRVYTARVSAVFRIGWRIVSFVSGDRTIFRGSEQRAGTSNFALGHDMVAAFVDDGFEIGAEHGEDSLHLAAAPGRHQLAGLAAGQQHRQPGESAGRGPLCRWTADQAQLRLVPNWAPSASISWMQGGRRLPMP
jgi:hypothetical protein